MPCRLPPVGRNRKMSNVEYSMSNFQVQFPGHIIHRSSPIPTYPFRHACLLDFHQIAPNSTRTMAMTPDWATKMPDASP